MDAATKIVKTAPCWSFFMTLFLLMFFMLQMVLDPLLMQMLADSEPTISDQIDVLDSSQHT
jgi:hypothetical protein